MGFHERLFYQKLELILIKSRYFVFLFKGRDLISRQKISVDSVSSVQPFLGELLDLGTFPKPGIVNS